MLVLLKISNENFGLFKMTQNIERTITIMKYIKYLILLILCITASMDLYASPDNAEFSGIVIDAETNESIPDVVVQIHELKKIKLTDENGEFYFSGIAPGKYEVNFSRLGYRREKRKLNVSHDTSVRIIFKMTPVGITSPAVVITGERGESKFSELAHETSELEGSDLQRELGHTLAATLKHETGVEVRSMGPAPARPVIRGLSGNRVMIAEDGIETNDLSATSPDHAVTIEPFSVEKIEIIRGPRVLLNTTSTIGGVVNAERNEIPEQRQSKPAFGGSMFYESANSGYLGALEAEVPLSPFMLKGGLSYRDASDVHSPEKVLDNTALITRSYNLGGSYVDEDFVFGGSVRQFSSEYGIPGGFIGGHSNGVDIEMLKRAYTGKGIYHLHKDFIDRMELNFSRTYYRHAELESGDIVGQEFVMRNYLADLRFVQSKNDFFKTGEFGLHFDQKQQKLGGLVLLPETESFTLAPYIFEDFNIGKYYFQFGFRYSYDRYMPKPYANSNKTKQQEREFHSVSASVSAMLNFSGDFYAGVNISRTSRPPTVEELYNKGPHLAAYSYDRGNPDLEEEHGIGLEAFIYHKTDERFIMITGFRNEMAYFITPRNTGDTNWSRKLPIYEQTGVGARLMGVESHIQQEFFENIKFIGTLSYTYGEFSGTASPLPIIPPFKSTLELKYSRKGFVAGILSEIAAAQKRTDKFEKPTDGYIIFNAYGQYMFEWMGSANNISLMVENIFNTTYRNHLSRIKSIMPEPGINLRLVYRIFI